MGKPTVTSSKKVFDSELFHVDEMHITFPNGIKKTHHNAQMRPVSVVLPIGDDYEVYLVSQYRYLIDQQTLEAVSGTIHSNETPLHAAKRELKEETGIEAAQWELLRTIEMTPSIFRISISIFLATNLERKKATPDDTEEISVIRLPLFRAIEKIYTCEINTPATIIGILLLDKLRKQKRI